MSPLMGRITIDPNVCFGKPCIKGTRIWVSLVLDYLASGMSEHQVLDEYPQLSHEDILAAILQYFSQLVLPFIITPILRVAHPPCIHPGLPARLPRGRSGALQRESA